MKYTLFFPPFSPVTVAEISKLTSAKLARTETVTPKIEILSALEDAGPGSLVFIEKKKYLPLLKDLVATAIFCLPEFVDKVPKGIAALVTETPYEAFCIVGSALYPTSLISEPILEAGISSKSCIHSEASLEDGVTVEAGAVIGANVEIGTGSIIAPMAVIANGCKIGRNCFIGVGSSLQCTFIGNRVRIHAGARIGQDGFGYIHEKFPIKKIPQLSCVIIQDDVEIGANTTIDRGSLRATVIGEGTKIDNLVQIAHNVQIGRFCFIAAHSGISGSSILGDMCHLGGRVGIADHLCIGSKVQIAAASGVMNDIPDGEKWGGTPARPFKKWLKETVTLRRISSKSIRKRNIR